MNIVRPPGGFRIHVLPAVQSYIDSETRSFPIVGALWTGLMARVSFTGLREGVSIRGKSPPRFTLVSEGDEPRGIPTIQIVYSCFSDTLTVVAALVMQTGEGQI